MKKPALLIIICLISFKLLAADGGPSIYIVQFSITKTNKQVIRGYSYVIETLMKKDSMSSTYFLKRLLSYTSPKEWDKRDSLYYYRGKMEYTCRSLEDNYEATLPTLTDKAVLSFKSIKKIKIESMTEFYGGFAIQNELKMADTIWLKKPVLQKVDIRAHLCAFQVFVYQKTKKVNSVLLEIEKLKEVQLTLDHALQQNYSLDPDRNKRDEIQGKIFELLRSLNGQRIVIIEECSC